MGGHNTAKKWEQITENVDRLRLDTGHLYRINKCELVFVPDTLWLKKKFDEWIDAAIQLREALERQMN